MKKIKRIVVGIDIFAKPDNVLNRALVVAKENKAVLFIVHAVKTPLFSIPSYFGNEEISIDIAGISKKIEKKMQTLNKDGKVLYTILVKEGNPNDVILHEAKLLKANMVVIGASRKSKKRYLGTTAEKVAHQSHIPVLVVKNRVKRPYRNILAPTDFQVQSRLSILFAKNIFPDAKIKVVNSLEVVYVDGPYTVVGSDYKAYNRKVRRDVQKDLKNFIKELPVKKAEIIEGEGNSKEVLLKYIDKGAYDLVVIGSRGTSGFKALLGSMASSILRETSCDVLLYVP